MGYTRRKRKTPDLFGGVDNWLDDKRRRSGCTSVNKEFVGEYNELRKMLGCDKIILFFLLHQCGIKDKAILDNLYAMHKSCDLQKGFCYAVKEQLKTYVLEEKWVPAFRRNVTLIRNRCEHLKRIICENLMLTEYWPYFEAVGFERLEDFGRVWPEEDKKAVAELQSDMAEWMASHAEEVEVYRPKAAEALENYKRFRAKKDADTKAEKQARRMARKAANDEVKEIRKNAKAYRARQAKIEKSFAAYYK